MRATAVWTGVIALSLAASASALEEPKLNAESYPQKSPEEALGSLIKALDARDYAYALAWLINPRDKEKLVNAEGSFDKAVAGGEAYFKKAAPEVTTLKKLLEAKVSRKEKEDKRNPAWKASWVIFEEKAPAGGEAPGLASVQFKLIQHERWVLNPPMAEPPLDTEKYPQDTPQKALDSLIKAQEANDFAYIIGRLLTAQARQLLIEAKGTFKNAVGDNVVRTAKLAAQTEALKIIRTHSQTKQDTGTFLRGKTEVKWARFAFERAAVQFEQEPGGLWSWNNLVIDTTDPLTREFPAPGSEGQTPGPLPKPEAQPKQ